MGRKNPDIVDGPSAGRVRRRQPRSAPRRRSAALVLFLLFATACSSPPPNLRPKNGSAPPAPQHETTYADLKPFLSNQSEGYSLYPGDTIRISVQGHPDLAVERTIPRSGKVPLYGFSATGAAGDDKPVTVSAAGKSIGEVETELAKLYSSIVKNPYVTVSVTQYAPKVIYVSGAVTNPKDYLLPNDHRISLVQALTMAGWFTPNADKDDVRVIRQDPKTGKREVLPPIDVGRIVSQGQVKLDILLEPGDTITVDSRSSRSVYIFGQVEQPGKVDYRDGMTLTQLITRAGGLKDYAKTSDIRVLRNGAGPKPRVFHVDLQDVFSQQAPDFRLEPGDVVYIDERFI